MTQTHLQIVDLASARLDAAAALDFVSDDAFGGLSMFVGRVRSHSHGREVVAVHYDMFDPLALAVFERAATEVIAAFGPAIKVFAAHAKGELGIGDLAVVIAVGSPHRDEAFKACRQVIESIKHQAPIWKRELFIDGETAWSEGCSLCHGGQAVDASAAHRHD